ncbi:arginase family protein [Brevibacterium sp. FAM 24638]|uniref:arginase family protein n=1 Tax=unclassified Brevibacterium TaxID=2614124 RepID=UPI003C7E4E92
MDEPINDRQLVVLDAPSNLGLRPPADGAVPGCYKTPWALRNMGLLRRLDADDAGTLIPPRYVADWEPGGGVRNGQAIADYAQRLAARLTENLEQGEFPVVLGGDCSILLGPALALRRKGRYGLAFVDAHADFRHLGNSPHVGAAAGEELALATGRGDAYLTDIGRLRPYFRDDDVVALGVRDVEDLRDIADSDIAVVSDPVGAAEAARDILVRDELDGFWIHVDADILDPSILPAVDSPTPGGLTAEQLIQLLADLLALPGATGLHLTVFDPDLDEDGHQAELLADVLVQAFALSHELKRPTV